MTPYHFQYDGKTRVLEAPAGYDHTKLGECVGLPVGLTDTGYVSVWKPSPEELETLRRRGGVALYVMGPQPPVSLDVVGPEALLVPA